MRKSILSTSLLVAASVAVTGCAGTQALEEETPVRVSASPPPPPEPEPEPEPERVKVTREMIEVNEKIHFELDSAKIREDSHELLQEIAQVINEHDELISISIEGHTDASGENAYNQGLSERRAKAVLTFLTERGGVDAERLQSEGFGEENPIADNETRDGRAKNRRVEFRIVERNMELADKVPVDEVDEVEAPVEEVPADEVDEPNEGSAEKSAADEGANEDEAADAAGDEAPDEAADASDDA